MLLWQPDPLWEEVIRELEGNDLSNPFNLTIWSPITLCFFLHSLSLLSHFMFFSVIFFCACPLKFRHNKKTSN